MSKFWKTLFRLNGTKLRMSTAYHSQIDRQTEVLNRCLQQCLRAFAHDKPKHWGKYLHWVERHYNTTTHTSTGLTPFQAVQGKPPLSLPTYILGTSNLEAVDTTLATRKKFWLLYDVTCFRFNRIWKWKLTNTKQTMNFKRMIGFSWNSSHLDNAQRLNRNITSLAYDILVLSKYPKK